MRGVMRIRDLFKKTPPNLSTTGSELDNDPLNCIDTIFWKTGDKEWRLRRVDEWQKIEKAISIQVEYKKNLNAVKAYFLRGKMPDWKGLYNARNPSTHLDLFLFLWLHPSWDEHILRDLRDRYLQSKLIVYDDVAEGFRHFFSSQALAPWWRYESEADSLSYPNVDGHGELLYKVMMGDPTITEYKLLKGHPLAGFPYHPETRAYTLPTEKFDTLCLMGAWLTVETMYPINEEFLYQYDLPLKNWFEAMKTDTETSLIGLHEDSIYSYQLALLQIHSFDTKREGDIRRSRFALKIRKLLDRSEFAEDFNETWAGIKSGKIVPKDPWEK